MVVKVNTFSELNGIKVAIYARVSTTEQAEEGYSIDEQVRILNKWCLENGYEVYKEYIDRGVSGKSINKRLALQQMMVDVNEKRFNMVLVWKTNRLARNLLDILKIVDLLHRNNVTFRSHSDNHETETPNGKLHFHVMAAVAEYERANIAENVKMGMLARARQGSWNGGKVLGYNTVETTNKSSSKKKSTKLVINEKEAQTVKRIFELYVEGNGYKSIANTINKEGHRSKKGNFFSIIAVKNILTNPVYVGLVRYNVRRDWNDKRRNNINPTPIIQEGLHSPIITKEVWDKAQSILKSRTGKPNRIHTGEFPLTGILKCPKCGAGMVLGRTTNRRKDGTKRVLEYYVCGAWKNKGTSVCNSNSVRTDYADAYVLNKLNLISNSNKLLHDIVGEINKNNNNSLDPLKKDYEVLKKEIHSIQEKKQRILKLYEDGDIEKVVLKERLNKLNEEIALLESRLSPIEEVVESNKTQNVSLELVKAILYNFSNNLNETTTREQRKQLLHLLIHEITINEDRKIETIRIQINKEVKKYLLGNGEEESLFIDDFSSPFCVYIDI
ncbi:recombinase family protein [Ammoniphilus sp. CFH 90114]|uniref:recombinase family protein n=1 Tax=Ammoniphilus sp. CFH 90114 TaxID=2493665 RepID=UPI00100F772C|nr:recombinase family protein [Ammoniphilus sp. CFH 90114]RXT08845.1 recombinase family protein [Ammoniphilus sp. CFH 90114]